MYTSQFSYLLVFYCLGSRYSQTVDLSSNPECRRSFEETIGHFAFMTENNRTFLLNESVVVKVLLQNSIRNILVRIVFENFVIANNVTLTRADVRVPEEKMYSYSGSLPVGFNHSGNHVLIAEVVGSDEDRLQKKLTVSVGRLTDIVSIALESCSSNDTVVLFAIIFNGFDESLMRMNLDFGDGTVLNEIEVGQSAERPSWVRSKLLGQLVVLEHIYAAMNSYTAILAVSSLNNGSVLTVQERVFVTWCNQDLSSFGKMIVFDSGFDQSYCKLLMQVNYKIFVYSLWLFVVHFNSVFLRTITCSFYIMVHCIKVHFIAGSHL